MTFRIRDASPPAQSAIRRFRPGGPTAIVQFQWHATRGANTMDRQVAATESWFASVANTLHPPGHPRAGEPRGWGGSAEFVVGPDYRLDGEIEIVRFGDTYLEHSTWSAGFGGSGTLPASVYGVAVEVAQPMGKDRAGNYWNDPRANFEPFTPETIDGCVWLVEQVHEELAVLGVSAVPAVHLTSWGQKPDEPIPAGHIGHEDLANGVKLGKHDPGHLFPWDELMRRLGEPSAPPAEPPDLGDLKTLQAVADQKATAAFAASRQSVEASRAVTEEIKRLERS